MIKKLENTLLNFVNFSDKEIINLYKNNKDELNSFFIIILKFSKNIESRFKIITNSLEMYMIWDEIAFLSNPYHIQTFIKQFRELLFYLLKNQERNRDLCASS